MQMEFLNQQNQVFKTLTIIFFYLKFEKLKKKSILGVGGIVVTLINGSQTLQTTTTNSSGFYMFCGIYPSPTVGYQVVFSLPNNNTVFTVCQSACNSNDKLKIRFIDELIYW